jgi:hypothetical protein
MVAVTTAPAAPNPPEPGLPATATREPVPDIFTWLAERETTWAGWITGVLLGFFCVVFGARGLYAYWRGDPPNKEKGIPSPPFAAGLLVFGAWVLWVFWNSKLPG